MSGLLTRRRLVLAIAAVVATVASAAGTALAVTRSGPSHVVSLSRGDLARAVLARAVLARAGAAPGTRSR
jgi:hypothetical protein